MKAKDWQEIRSLSEIEFNAKLRDFEDQIFRLKFKHSSTPLKNGLEIRALRRKIAQLKTLKAEQSLASQQSAIKQK